MAWQVIVHREGAGPERLSVTGLATAGGSDRDAVALPGAPGSALLLEPDPSGVRVEARAEGVRVAGEPLPAGNVRLVRGGERVELPGGAFEVEPERVPDGTRALAGRVLRQAAAGEPALLEPHLLVLAGPQAGRRFPLAAEQVLGRGESAAIRLGDPQASRLHARLWAQSGRLWIEDLGSKNGLSVNGAPARGRVRLQPGDEIRAGRTTLVLQGSPLEISPAQDGSAAPEPEELRRPGAMAEEPPGAAWLAAGLLLAASTLALVLAG